jgi:hypothetical protein
MEYWIVVAGFFSRSLFRRVRFEQAAFETAKGVDPTGCLALGFDAAEKTELWHPGDPRGDPAQVLGFHGDKAFRHFPAAPETFGWRNHKMIFKPVRRSSGRPSAIEFHSQLEKMFSLCRFVEQVLTAEKTGHG